MQLAVPTEDFRVFPQLLQTNAVMVPKKGNDRFLPHPFQFIIPNHPTNPEQLFPCTACN
jgi:hypothetical protein